MVCVRCNKLRSDGDRCSVCDMPLKPIASQQRRGWIAFGAGVFLVVLIAGLWIWVDRLFIASGAPARDPAAAQFIARINVVFGLVLVAGLLGAANGWIMARSGLRNFPLMVGMLVVFVGALILGFMASNGYQPH